MLTLIHGNSKMNFYIFSNISILFWGILILENVLTSLLKLSFPRASDFNLFTWVSSTPAVPSLNDDLFDCFFSYNNIMLSDLQNTVSQCL